MDTDPNTTQDPPLDPTLVAERTCYRRGTTPRNASPQKRSTNSQVDGIDVEEIEYTDDVVETYADEVTRRLNDMVKCGDGSYAAIKRLVNVNVLDESTDKLACGKCAKDVVGDTEGETMEKFREFVAKDGVNTATNELIDRFVDFRQKK